MSRVFVTSDTHFGHRNIIRYCQRPFKKAAEMSEAIAARWNARVSAEDTVYFLGDFAMGPKVDDEFVVRYLQMLNGKIRVVLGNHDQPSKKYGMSGLRGVVEDYEFDDVWPDLPDIEFLPDIHEEKIEGRNFVMCHYPMSDWNGKFHGAIHLHGHCHTIFSETEKKRMVKNACYDVGVDMYGGPVQITNDLRYLNDPKGWE